MVIENTLRGETNEGIVSKLISKVLHVRNLKLLIIAVIFQDIVTEIFEENCRNMFGDIPGRKSWSNLYRGICGGILESNTKGSISNLDKNPFEKVR